ncbi:MAG: DNA methylase, partial [Desulfobacula sp.]|nr:DNA methylase [Desulfobacula sp.]
FYTKRNLWILSAFWDRLSKAGVRFPFLFTASQRVLSKLASIAFSYFFHGGGGFVNAGTKGTLYISSTNPEVSPFNSLTSRLRSMKFYFNASVNNSIIQTQSATTNSNMKENSVDYIFIDPPFGSNINYSELNTLWEPWLGVITNNELEAIENSVQDKGLIEYRKLMTKAFKKAFNLLKPGRWMTVEFSNTKASVWNNIQTSITDAGFVVANVSALDKKQRSFKAYTTPTAVKQDLIISAYKPNGGFTERFKSEADSEKGVWDFVQTHLKYLPVIKETGAYYQAKKATGSDMDSDDMKPRLQAVPERDPRILYDQVVSYYVRNNLAVPISSMEFQQGLESRFIPRDGMYFLPEQAAVYDKKRLVCQPALEVDLFVSDEASAIQWLRTSLNKKPQTFSELNAPFMQQLGGWKKNELQLDLRQLLHDNFLCNNGKDRVPEQIHAYLSSNYKNLRNLEKDDPQLTEKAKDRWYVPDPNKAGDLEKLREKSLLKEFEQYRQSVKKLKVFRLEAVRAGFKKAWQEKEYHLIIQVAEKMPNNILEEDQKLLVWYDQALTRSQG